MAQIAVGVLSCDIIDDVSVGMAIGISCHKTDSILN